MEAYFTDFFFQVNNFENKSKFLVHKIGISLLSKVNNHGKELFSNNYLINLIFGKLNSKFALNHP